MQTVKITPWTIHRVSPVDDFSETIFFVGNGTLGVRGYGAWAGKPSPQAHAIFRAGLFSEIKPGITDMVQLPDVLTLRPAGEEPQAVNQTLDIRSGVLTQSWETADATLSMQRAASMADSQLLLQRLTVTAKRAGFFTVETAANSEVANLPIHDDQTLTATEYVRLLHTENLTERSMRLLTVREGTKVEIVWEVTDDREANCRDYLENQTAFTAMTAVLSKGDTWTIEKRIRVLVGDEVKNPNSETPWEANAGAWSALWDDCDIEIETDDDELQGALRFNIFQLLSSNASDDPTVSIGARGLSHGRYKGNTFWDTEIFMFPFYLWTRPDAARNLIRYRIDRFGDARTLAKKQNLNGARYPWMSSQTGEEQCESWDIGQCEIHITADVVYAMQRYIETTGDDNLLRTSLGEIYKQTALYWMSRFTREERDGRYSCFFVKGPDEYCGITVNNTYTNYMARYNVMLALEYGNLTEQERFALAEFADHIVILYDAQRDLFLQDETFERLESLNITGIERPVYKKICFDRLQRCKALKQADLVQLTILFPRDFTPVQRQTIFDTYEPLTTHDSTLSFGMHALAAFQAKRNEKAVDYLYKAAFLDLHNLMNNTGNEGIHLGACGSLWQAIVFGAAGLSSDGVALDLAPNLPGNIRSMKFKVKFKGAQYQIHVKSGTDSMITKL